MWLSADCIAMIFLSMYIVNVDDMTMIIECFILCRRESEIPEIPLNCWQTLSYNDTGPDVLHRRTHQDAPPKCLIFHIRDSFWYH